MKQFTARVVSNQQVLKKLERLNDLTRRRAPDILGTRIIRFSCPEIARDARPGQYLMVTCGEDTLLPRPFSIHQVKNGEIAILYAVLEGGKGTGWLSRLEKDDELKFFGPLGNAFEIHPDSRNLLLVAGGLGIAPLNFLAVTALGQGLRVTLCLGASGVTKPSGEDNPNQLFPLSLLPPGIQVSTITSSPDGKTGNVTELLPEFIDRSDQVFACGPTPMYRVMAGMPELKNKPVQVSLEVRMACGRGLCYGCSVKTTSGMKKVCETGPVFELGDIIWDELNPV